MKQKAEMVTIVDAKRANNISIALSGIRLPYAKIKARLYLPAVMRGVNLVPCNWL